MQALGIAAGKSVGPTSAIVATLGSLVVMNTTIKLTAASVVAVIVFLGMRALQNGEPDPPENRALVVTREAELTGDTKDHESEVVARYRVWSSTRESCYSPTVRGIGARHPAFSRN